MTLKKGSPAWGEARAETWSHWYGTLHRARMDALAALCLWWADEHAPAAHWELVRDRLEAVRVARLAMGPQPNFDAVAAGGTR